VTTLPHSLEAERSVLGGILLQPKAFPEVASLLLVGDFYHTAHAAIWQAMVALDQKSTPIDMRTVYDQMRVDDTLGALRAFHGEAYFADLTSAVVTVENLAHHATIVRDRTIARNLILAGQEIMARGYGGDYEIKEFAATSESVIQKATERLYGGGTDHLATLLPAAMKGVEARFERKSAVTGVPTGFGQLDLLTAGFQPKDLVVIAGRPSMGKTALALNACVHAGMFHDIPCLVFSMEMGKSSLVDRMLCSEGRVDSTRVRSGHLFRDDWIALTSAATRLSTVPLWIDDTSSQTIHDVRAKARRWRNDKRMGGANQKAMVVLDYLTLLAHTETKGVSPAQLVSGDTRMAKMLAKELDCPVVLLSQLNREVEKRQDKRPQLSDLRESGSIEQDADVVVFLYRDEVYNRESPDKGTAEVLLSKQRNGPIGRVKLAFINPYARFDNLAYDGPRPSDDDPGSNQD
jgi:replicative DNA helicase